MLGTPHISGQFSLKSYSGDTSTHDHRFTQFQHAAQTEVPQTLKIWESPLPPPGTRYSVASFHSSTNARSLATQTHQNVCVFSHRHRQILLRALEPIVLEVVIPSLRWTSRTCERKENISLQNWNHPSKPQLVLDR